MAKVPFIQSVPSECVGVATNIARLTRSLAAMELLVLSTPLSYLAKIGSSGQMTASTPSPRFPKRPRWVIRLIPTGLNTETDFALCQQTKQLMIRDAR